MQIAHSQQSDTTFKQVKKKIRYIMTTFTSELTI